MKRLMIVPALLAAFAVQAKVKLAAPFADGFQIGDAIARAGEIVNGKAA